MPEGSPVSAEIASTSQTPETKTESSRPAPAPAPWVWMVGACLLLAGSGGVRLWQEWRYQAAFENAKTPPFPLRSLPTEVGKWSNRTGEGVIDKDTLTIAGSSDYMARRYTNDNTGVSLDVLVVFGPAEKVFGHSATVCFPAIGFKAVEQDPMRLIPLSSAPEGSAGPKAQFRSMVFSKPKGDGSDERIECFWSFWHDGVWSPDATRTRKLFRHHPDMFKVQVQRQVLPGENRTDDNLTEDFLKAFLPILQERIEKSRSVAAR